MRLWSLHPRYLDARGLVALWREALLAQAVLAGTTAGYRNHPQLLRFRQHPAPLSSIAQYLRIVHAESAARGYRFDRRRIARRRTSRQINVPQGQMEFEWRHLMDKLSRRSPRRHEELLAETSPLPHPLFHVVPGGIAEWEAP
ncbi:MAG: pyrimidine dimer DNA glycosylase/endonuclease V [Deltaproteobacteria bacterium]|nr:pyrimidine dimer DNA glycosylase/endonuclease V [Deltaproteobacteria bacterium]